MDYSAFFTPVLTLVMAQITVIELTRFRFEGWKLKRILIIVLVLQVCLSGPLLVIFGLDSYAKWFMLFIVLPGIAVAFYISRYRDMRVIFTVLVTIYISFLASLPSIYISHFFHGGHRVYNISRILFFLILIVILHRFIRRQYLQIQVELEKGWGIYCILPTIGIGFIYYEYSRFCVDRAMISLLRILVIVLLLAVIFILFLYVFQELHDRYRTQEQQRILLLQNKAQREQYEQQKYVSEISNRRWHDLRHHTLALIELLEAGDTAKALEYLKEQNEMKLSDLPEYCSHPSVNSILSLWVERSQKADIRTEINTDIPKSLEIDPLELSTIFTNAFENAYEACCKLPEKQERFIKVTAQYSGAHLTIDFTNSYIEEVRFEDGFPISQAKGGGVGTRSIAYIVKHNHGNLFFVADKGVFTARIVLNI